MTKGVLVDLSRCMGCRACQIACKEWNQLPARETTMSGEYTNPKALSSDCYTRIRFLEDARDIKPMWSFVKDQCLHCQDPACASACPVGALQKSDSGAVIYDQFRCIGCRYCMVACPFHIPRYEWYTTDPWVQKCTFCADRLDAGIEPACIKVCPKEVMYFDDLENVHDEARHRINSNPGKYINYIYGMREAGGTSWMYISDKPFEDLGFDMQVAKAQYPAYTWKSLSNLPWEAVGLIAVLSGIAYIRNRRTHKEGE